MVISGYRTVTGTLYDLKMTFAWVCIECTLVSVSAMPSYRCHTDQHMTQLAAMIQMYSQTDTYLYTAFLQTSHTTSFHRALCTQTVDEVSFILGVKYLRSITVGTGTPGNENIEH